MAEDQSLNSIAADLAALNVSNIYNLIDKHSVHGLNLTTPEDAKTIIKPWDDREDTTKWAESNVDDQLIIHVPFMENVRIRSILLKLGRGETTPRHLRIYVNHNTIIDFSDAEQTKPHLNITLQEGENGAAAFSSVHSLSLFFNEAVGDEVSRIYYLGFKGDMRHVKKEVASRLEVPAQNAADATLMNKAANRAAQQPTAR
ncbi:galactose-binding domain-like protein [Coprinopsis sp. MPI-PUGE-AT-0042]|nr:galactose-binding domain-like protein [Coprinopsis sp. MPI-PUGE-AT-0042]